jgi:Caspase domain/Sulfatase-modifying factor enzyme 1
MPVDAKLTDEADLRRMTRVDEIVADLQQAKNLRILVLDACRDNPLAEDLRRSIGLTRAASLQRGLARIDAPHGMIVAYATQAGRTAADGISRNSPYTAAFLKHIETPEEIGTLFRLVTADVYEATNRTQLPELSLSLIGQYYLRGKPQSTATAPRPQPSTAPVQPPAAIAPVAPVQTPAPTPSPAQVAVAVPPVAPTPAGPCAPGVPLTVSLALRSAAPLSAAEECALKPKDVFKECDKCPEMVAVAAGSFIMGSPPNEPGRFDDEGPQHQVNIGKSFAVGKFHVTVEQFATFAAETGYGNGSKCLVFEGGISEQKEGRS